MKEGIHYSKELESAVIGACLLEKTALSRIYGIIKPEMFHLDDNKEIFSCIVSMYERNIPIDLTTAWHELVKAGKENLNAGNASWVLCQRTLIVVSSAHLEYHGHILRSMWQTRELERITNSGIDSSENPQKNIYSISNQLNEILGNDVKKDWYDMTDLMYDLMSHQAQISEGKKKLLTTGLKYIDRINGGFSEGDMIVIGARPGIGKSAFITGMALEIANQGEPVGIISLEMSNSQIAARLASIETGIDFRKIYQNLFDDENQQKRFHDIITRKSINKPIFVSDKTRVDVTEIKAKAMKLKHTHKCKCLIVDYLQLIETDESAPSREREVAKISRGIKLMALDMKIPIIVLVQLNREVTKRANKDRYPKLSDIRESGSLEQDADIVMMIHRDFPMGFTQNEDGSSTEKDADVFGVKWRNGSPFHLKLDFDPPTMKFSERSGLVPIHSIPMAPKLPYADDKENPF